jgi:Ca2+-binding EF-hand superfamily protein
MSGSQSAGRIKAIFAEIDRDNSGTIDRDEFAKAMKILRVDLTSREIQAVGAVVVMIRFRVSKWITVAVSYM